jgi:hypothetical protein
MGSALNIISGAATISVDGSDIGYTRNGVTLEMNADIEVVESVSSSASAVKAIKKNEAFYVVTNLAEATLENLKIAWGINTAIASETLHFGGDPTVPEHTLVIVGEAAGSNTTRTVTFYKAISVEYSGTTYRKDDILYIPVRFRVLLDKSKDAGKQLGYIVDS